MPSGATSGVDKVFRGEKYFHRGRSLFGAGASVVCITGRRAVINKHFWILVNWL